jgi:hypothetical protein
MGSGFDAATTASCATFTTAGVDSGQLHGAGIFQATQPDAGHTAGITCAVEQTAKATWQVHADPSQALQVRYTVHAYDASVRTAWLDALRGFFNPTSLCLIAIGHEEQALIDRYCTA